MLIECHHHSRDLHNASGVAVGLLAIFDADQLRRVCRSTRQWLIKRLTSQQTDTATAKAAAAALIELAFSKFVVQHGHGWCDQLLRPVFIFFFYISIFSSSQKLKNGI